MAKALIVEILADAKQFGAELDRAAGKTRQMGKVAGVAGLAIAGGLAVGLEKSVKAAMAAQTSTAKMETAFKTAGLSADAFSSQISKAEDSSRNLGFSNIDVRDSLGSLVVATHSGTAAIRDLGIAEDIARFKHIDLASASKTLTMAMAGSQRATKQLGLSVQAVTTAEDKVKERFKDHTTAAYKAALATASLTDKAATSAQVIDLVSQKLHGQAQAFANTASGGMAQFHAQMEALQENLGAALLPALVAVTSKLADFTGWLAKHTNVAKAAVIALAAIAAGFIAISVASTIATAAASPWILIAAGIAAAAVGIGIAFAYAWRHSETFRDIVKGVFAVLRIVVEGYVAFYKAVIVGAIDVSIAAFQKVKAIATHLWDGVKSIWNATIGSELKVIIGLVNDLISVLKIAADFIHAVASAAHTIGDVVSGRGTRNLPPGVGPRGQGGPRPRLHAAGGIFTRPTLLGNDMFGESGPEALIPLNSPQAQGMLGGVTVQVGPVYGTVDAGFAQKLATQLATQLRGGRAPQLQQAIRAI